MQTPPKFQLTEPVSSTIKPVVLILSDDSALVNSIKTTIADMCNVAVAADVSAGMDYLLCAKASIVALDIDSNFELDFFDKVIRTATENEMAVFILTAKNDMLKARLLQSGAQDFLSKPVITTDLICRIKSLTNGPQIEATRQIIFGRYGCRLLHIPGYFR